jgi:hypothetical protein
MLSQILRHATSFIVLSDPSETIIIGFLIILLVVSLMPHPPTSRTRISLFVWVITFDLSGTGDHTSSYTTASIALRDQLTTQASPLDQSRNTFGENQ